MCTKEAVRRAWAPFSNLLCPLQLLSNSRLGRAARGILRTTGAPPLYASRIGTAGQADVHCRAIALEGRSRRNYPCGKARNDTRDGQDGTHERPRYPRGTAVDPQEADGGEAPRPPRFPLSGLRLSELPERRFPLR